MSDWRTIDSAPKDKKLIVGYQNEAGHWRTIMARYYFAGTLDAYDDSEEDEYAPEGWYEESDSHENLLPTDKPPTHWMPLPDPPVST